MKKKVLMSWSSGKDSAWALYKLQQDPTLEIIGLFSTVNSEFNRVAMHGVRVELLKKQAESIGLPIDLIEIPYPCSNEEYENKMSLFVEQVKERGIEYFAFGDLYLEDIRQYRVDKLQNTGIEPIFPVWGIPTDSLSKDMISSGLRTIITCIDPRKISKEFAGREYTNDFISDLPAGVDPCGENGEFHSFVFDGPMFTKPIEIEVGEVVTRDDFVFADVRPT